MLNKWHKLTIEKTFGETNSSIDGLTSSEAEKKLLVEGENILETKKSITPLEILIEQFKDFLIMLLIVAALISISVGIYEQSVQEMVEAGLILLIVVFIVVIGFYQQYHAEKELEALKNMMTPSAKVLRDGEKVIIDAAKLVIGDIIFLESGDRVPADLRIIESVDLKSDEASLTGESTPVEKQVKPLDGETLLADRTNMLYMATSIVYGKVKAVVVSKGMQTELGKIAESIKEIKEEKTPLQERLTQIGKQIGIVVILLCAIVFTTGLIFQESEPLEMFIVAIALAVAAVPEGLPGVVTVALATGTRRMVKENAIIRKLPAVETLGSTTVICTDKTGTLTKNEMTIKKLWVPGKDFNVEGDGYSFKGKILDSKNNELDKLDEDLKKLLSIGVLCNDAGAKDGKITGDPTEASILVTAAKAGIFQDELNKANPRVDEIPFSSERKRLTTVHETKDGKYAYTIGAPDVVVGLCSKIFTEGVEKELSSNQEKTVQDQNSKFGTNAYRVLGFAYKKITGDYNHENLEQDLVFTGLVAMIDPPREESKTSVSECANAGIKVVMITGDHQITAKAIASDIGIFHEGDGILTGKQLEEMSDEDLLDNVDTVSVYARVSPIHKLRIVDALKKKGNVVAMTGDGVNDAPALKRADIGIAMGITGTDVSKESADMVLTDDNFSSIVKAVKEGRGIYDNIKKFFAYLISGNIGEVAIVFLSSIIPGVPIALTANQILIINFVTDAFPALALGVDPFEPGAMKRKPRKRSEPLYKGLAPFIVWYPILMIGITMGLFIWVWNSTKDVFQAQTVAFLSINLFESWQAFSARSTRYPSLKVGMFKNKWLLLSIIFSVVILPILLYIPIWIPFTGLTLQELAHISPISPKLFLLVIVLSSIGFIYLEIAKWWNTRNEEYDLE